MYICHVHVVSCFQPSRPSCAPTLITERASKICHVQVVVRVVLLVFTEAFLLGSEQKDYLKVANLHARAVWTTVIHTSFVHFMRCTTQ